MSVPATDVLAWTLARSGECIPAVGVLGVRPLRYQADLAEPVTPAVPNLVVRVRGHAERPLWHPDTGIYGFLDLPPGPAILELLDPARRYLPAVIKVTVPDRSVVRDALATCARPPVGSPGPTVVDVAMRATPEMVLPPGSTVIWGVVRLIADASAVPGALLRLDSVRDGNPVTMTTQGGPDGSYLFVLPGEVSDRTLSPPGRDFARALRVFVPRSPLAGALADGFVAAIPTDLYTSDPAAPGSPLEPRGFRLRDADGAVRTGPGGSDPVVPFSVGERVRWDLEVGP